MGKNGGNRFIFLIVLNVFILVSIFIAPSVYAFPSSNTLTVYRVCDADGDGVSNSSSAALGGCAGTDCDDDTSDDPPGCPTDPTNCDQTNSGCAICIHPGATEYCDGVDNNCAGGIDEGGDSLCDDGVGCTIDSCLGGTCLNSPNNSACPDTECAEYACNLFSGCQLSRYNSSGDICRPAVGACGQAESCTGISPDCPPDLNSTSECRAGTECSPAEVCDGTSYDCPPDQNFSLGTQCGQFRDCPDNTCDGFLAKIYPADSQDQCDGMGNCVVYSCTLQNTYCSDNDPGDNINNLLCGAECDQQEDCQDKCVGDTFFHSGSCTGSCLCSYTTQDCSLLSGWIETSNTQWVDHDTNPCLEKLQIEKENRTYTCGVAGCEYIVEETQWFDSEPLQTRNKAFGTLCEDGNLCTENDYCDSGSCVSGTPSDCSDPFSCTDDGCIPSTGACTHTPNNTICAALDPLKPVCNPILFNPPTGCGTDIPCNSDDECDHLDDNCNEGKCNLNNHECYKDPLGDGTSCLNSTCVGLIFNLEDTCQAGVCTDSGTEDCSLQADVCNLPVCDNTVGCDKTPKPNGTVCLLGECNDRIFSLPDTCQDGICADSGTEDCSNNDILVERCDYNPDDINETWDFYSFTSACQAVSGCIQPDLNWQNFITHTCDYLQCQAECDSSHPCQEKCEAGVHYFSGSCSSIFCTCNYDTENCDDDDGWVETNNIQWVDHDTDQCKEKLQLEEEYRDFSCGVTDCEFTVTNTQWVDSSPLQTRSKAFGTLCEDGNLCTENDYCDSGSCISGTPSDCSDLFSCTDDGCIPSTGACTHTPNNTICAALDPLKPVCNPILFDPPTGCGTDMPCNNDAECSGDLCNEGKCNLTTHECYLEPFDDGMVCIGSHCSEMIFHHPQTCSAGICAPASTTNCSLQENACNFATCNDVTGCGLSPKPNGTQCSPPSCSANRVFSPADTCQDGVCADSGTEDCADEDRIVNQCDFDPDAVDTTLDYYIFTSSCDINSGCSQAPANWISLITHTCDSDCGAECLNPGLVATQNCGVSDIGRCELGTHSRTCGDNCLWGQWSDCVGNIDPVPEICNGLDDDCDNVPDNGLDADDCEFVCEAGTWIYNGTKTGQHRCCGDDPDLNEDNPYQAEETLCDGKDNDCDGDTDEGCTGCIIINATWNVGWPPVVQEGENVNLEVYTENCIGETLNFEVWEKDGHPVDIGPDDSDDPVETNPSSVVIDQNRMVATWTAEWQDDDTETEISFSNTDIPGQTNPPEYYFIAQIEGEDMSSQSMLPYLLVAKTQRRQRSITLEFEAGRNIFSLPLFLDISPSIGNIFAQVADNIILIAIYDNETWYFYSDLLPNILVSAPSIKMLFKNIGIREAEIASIEGLDQISRIESTKGYIIISKNPFNITLTGYVDRPNFSKPRVKIKTGWTLMGTHSKPINVSRFFWNHNDDVFVVGLSDTGNFVQFGLEEELNPVQGYWVYSTQEFEVNPITGR